ncbi:hypothetical protein DFH07DRAFT_771632 [Mycena maculata]|uniref:Uncharacterized protein n=1 Tax=Mycena maculata TaxID=230809 RepID=A0AAD7JAX6_9AGAR|nr:hypothetical protein DFH07DRAFT_771632 [Mycena maculata]
MASNVDQTSKTAAERAIEDPTVTLEAGEMFGKVGEHFNLSGGVGCKRAQAQVNARTSHTSQPTQIQTKGYPPEDAETPANRSGLKLVETTGENARFGVQFHPAPSSVIAEAGLLPTNGYTSYRQYSHHADRGLVQVDMESDGSPGMATGISLRLMPSLKKIRIGSDSARAQATWCPLRPKPVQEQTESELQICPPEQLQDALGGGSPPMNSNKEKPMPMRGQGNSGLEAQSSGAAESVATRPTICIATLGLGQASGSGTDHTI